MLRTARFARAGAADCTAHGDLAKQAAKQSAAQSQLDTAHALEVRGRLDLASQQWQQVLLADPNNAEALGGLARAAKYNGNTALANSYLDRLRAINPERLPTSIGSRPWAPSKVRKTS